MKKHRQHNILGRVAIGLLSLLLAAPAYARVAINKTTDRKPAQMDPDSRLANATFINFLNCSRYLDTQTDGRSNKNDQELHRCVAQNFSSQVSPKQVDRYSEALIFPNEYSELFECDAAMVKMVKTFEDKDYDLFRCFDSNIMAPDKRVGVVFFKKEHGGPKILRLKM